MFDSLPLVYKYKVTVERIYHMNHFAIDNNNTISSSLYNYHTDFMQQHTAILKQAFTMVHSAPCGAGKSHCVIENIASTIKDEKSSIQHIIIIVPGVQLTRQFKTKTNKLFTSVHYQDDELKNKHLIEK